MNLTEAQKIKAIVGLGALSISGASFAAGYKVAQSRLRSKYEEIAQREIAEAKVYYSVRPDEELVDPEELLKQTRGRRAANPTQPSLEEQAAYKDRLKDLKYAPTVIESPKETEEELMVEKIVDEKAEEAKAEIRNVFETDLPEPGLPEWNFVDEIANRTEEFPYVIHKDEFYEGEYDYEQVSLTYFDGDGVLVDSHDQMVDDVDKKVGLLNLERFGHGSGDPNVVHIRNDLLEIDFEIARHEGSYGAVVHDIRHSDDEMLRVPRRRRRLED